MPGGMSLHNGDRDSLGDDGRIVGDVKTIPENKLKGMAPGGQLDIDFRLPSSKVKMAFVGRDGLVHRRKLLHVDEEVMVAGAAHLGACRRNAHTS